MQFRGALLEWSGRASGEGLGHRLLMQGVRLAFLYLDILAADCNMDRIEIYEGINADVPSRKICNGNRVVEFISSSDTDHRRSYIHNTDLTYAPTIDFSKLYNLWLGHTSRHTGRC